MTAECPYQLRWATLLGLAGFSAVALAATLLVLNPTSASAAEAPVGLGTAGNFSVLAGSTDTDTDTDTQPDHDAGGRLDNWAFGEIEVASNR